MRRCCPQERAGRYGRGVSGFALLPLDTSHSLPGWPVPPPVPGLHFFIVLLFIPAAITLIIVLGVTAANMRNSNRVTSEGVLDAEPEPGPAVEPGGAAAAVEQGETRELSAEASGTPAEEETAEPVAARRAEETSR